MDCDSQAHHQWEHQRDVSKTFGAQRYKCSVCGVWGYRFKMSKPVMLYNTPPSQRKLDALRRENVGALSLTDPKGGERSIYGVEHERVAAERDREVEEEFTKPNIRLKWEETTK